MHGHLLTGDDLMLKPEKTFNDRALVRDCWLMVQIAGLTSE